MKNKDFKYKNKIGDLLNKIFPTAMINFSDSLNSFQYEWTICPEPSVTLKIGLQYDERYINICVAKIYFNLSDKKPYCDFQQVFKG